MHLDIWNILEDNAHMQIYAPVKLKKRVQQTGNIKKS